MRKKEISKVIGKKLILFILLMIFITFISFALIEISPIDPITSYARTIGSGLSEQRKAVLVEKWGLDKGFLTRYLLWLKNLCKGDLGISNIYQRPVGNIIWESFKSSAMLMALAWILQGILGVFLGIISGLNKNKLIDRIIKTYCIIISSTPTFWVALMMIMLFSVKLKIFPIGFSMPIGMLDQDVTLADKFHHMILPSITLALVGTAAIALHTREKVIEILNSDFIIFAKSMGVKGIALITKYGLKNILLPAVTLQFTSFSELFSGMVLAENAFNYPGLGRIAVKAGLGADAPLLLGITLISAIFVFAGNQIADGLYLAIDPRIRKGEI